MRSVGSAARAAIAPNPPAAAAIAHIMRIVASTLLSIRQAPQSAVAPEGRDVAIEALQGAKRSSRLDPLRWGFPMENVEGQRKAGSSLCRVLAPVAADAQVGLLLVAPEPLDRAEAAAIFADHGARLRGPDLLIGAGLE